MNIETIRIELLLEDKEEGHATIIEFRNGMWTANGPMFPRISGSLQEIYNLLRGKK